MANTMSRAARAETLLQDGVAAASAVLFAISAGNMLGGVPADPSERNQHNHATQLLSMLEDSLRAMQQQVDALAPSAENGEA
jgi:hypothetical protein